MARPKEFTEDKRARVVQLIKDGHTQQSAAEVVGVSSETIRREKQSNPDFKTAFEEAAKGALGEIGAALFQKAIGGSVQAMKLWLEHFKESMEDSELTPEQEDLERERREAAERLLPPMDEVEY